MNLQPLRNRLDRMPMLKAFVPFAAGIVLSGYGTLPLWFLTGGLSVVRSDGTAHAFVGGNDRDAADGGIRRRAAPHIGPRHTGRRPHLVRTAHRGDARRPGPLRNRDGPGRGVARPGPRDMAPRLVAHPPLRRLAHPHRRRRADPLPRHGAPHPPGKRELSEADAPAGHCRHAVAGSRQPARAPSPPGSGRSTCGPRSGLRACPSQAMPPPWCGP